MLASHVTVVSPDEVYPDSQLSVATLPCSLPLEKVTFTGELADGGAEQVFGASTTQLTLQLVPVQVGVPV